MTTSESAPRPAGQSARARRRSARRRMLPKTAGERAAMLEALARRAYPSIEYFIFSLLCSAIIGAAYLLDAPALVLLGVLFAPLMTPWIGVTLATVTGSALFFLQAAGSFLIGGLLIFLTGTLSGFAARLWLPIPLNQALLHSRLWWPDLAVLAVGAVVLALSFVRSEDKPFLPSVILAYELYLPIASAGFGLGSGVPNLFPDGLLVFAIHFAWATLFGVLTLALMGFRPATFAGFTLGTTLVLAGVVLLLGLSGLGAVIQTRLGLMPPPATPTSIPLPTLTPSPTETQTTLSGLIASDTLTPTASAASSQRPGASMRPSSTPTIFVPPTATATSTLTPEPTPVYALVAAKGSNGAIVRALPGGAYVTSLFNGHLVQVVPGETQIYQGVVWIHITTVTADGRPIDGWILQTAIATATPEPDW